MKQQDHEIFWQNTTEYSTQGYEGFKLDRRKYLAEKIVNLNPKSVLEIGCFGGYNLREIHKLNPNILLTGFDINKGALSYAKEKLPVLTTVNGSIYDLDKYFTENQFDIVFTAGVFIHIPTLTDKITSDIKNISKNYVFHAEHHGDSYLKIPNRSMRYIHNFKELYNNCADVSIETALNASNRFEHIIKITL